MRRNEETTMTDERADSDPREDSDEHGPIGYEDDDRTRVGEGVPVDAATLHETTPAFVPARD